MHKPITVGDGSALLTGLLLAFCLPPELSLGLAAFGSFCAVVIGKQVFGGLGSNIFNPAHLPRHPARFLPGTDDDLDHALEHCRRRSSY